MIEPSDLLKYVIRPVIKDMGLWSVEAEKLLLGTACQESGCGRFLHQIGGPAVGIYQPEPNTIKDMFINYLPRHPKLLATIKSYSGEDTPWADEVVWNLRFATAICRAYYLRVPAPIPDSLPMQAAYWKQHYNTELGKGSADDYMRSWYRYVGHGTWV